MTGSVQTWDETGGGNVAGLSIQIMDQSSLVAPAVMVFRAVPGAGFQLSTAPLDTPYEPWRHEITYVWKVRNTPLSFERAPHLNMPDDWKDANVYYGPEAVIVFDGPGTYHIDLFAIDRFRNYGEASIEDIVVGSADAGFPGGATIAVSDNSDFTGAPVGATTISLGAQSWSAVNAAIAARGNTDTRVLMKAGVDFRSVMPVGQQFNLSTVSDGQILVDAFGAGAKPIIPLPKNTGASQDDVLFRLPRDNAAGGAKFRNLDMRGNWEADKERGYIGASPLWRDIRTDVLFQRCRISGYNTIETQFRSGDCYFIWSDGEATNWADMGLYLRKHAGGIKRQAIIGSDIHQHETARQGYGKSGFQNQHGCVRCEDNNSLHLHAVDLFSRNGWSAGFSSVSADQPCLRVNSEGSPNANTIGDRVATEGGYQVIKMAGQDPGDATPDTPGNHLFDKFLTIGTPETQYHVECKMGGTTLRNGLSVEFNVPKYSGGIRTAMYDMRSDDTLVAGNNDTPVAIYNCTLVSLLSSANNRALSSSALENINGILDGGTFNSYDQANNVTYMPNQNTPDAATPVDIATPLAGVTPRFKGIAESITEIQVTGSGTNTIIVPYSALRDKDGNATNQAFWQARVAAGSTLHHVKSDGEKLFSDLGEVTVSYQSNGAHVQRTSGTFGNGGSVSIKLDQSDTLDPPAPSHSITAFSVPAATLLGTALAETEFVSPDTFALTPRTGRGMPGASSGSSQKGAM